MKKVLFTATVDSHILAFHIPFLKYFKEEGYEVHVATNGNEKIPYCDKKHYISFERSPFKLNNLKAIKQMKKLVEKEKFDIIHTHTPMGSVVTRLGARKARKNGTRVIYTAHGFHFYKGAPLLNWLLFYPVEKFLSRYTDTLITINKEDYERAKKKFKKCRDIQYVPGVGIDEEKFNFEMTEKEKNELRKSLGLKKDDFVMIYPAELNKNKNQLMLINAMKDLVKEHKNIHLLLPGKDSYNGYYHKLVEELNLKDNIHFLGFRKDIPRLLKISNISVASSRREGLPVNILEAMYVGLPIIATDCRGQRDLVENGKNGFLIKQDNVDEFKKCVKKIYVNAKNCDNILKHNKKKISEYLLPNITKILNTIYIKNKKLVFVHTEEKVKKDEFGNLYTDGSYNESVWNRYLSINDDITAIFRIEKEIYKKTESEKKFQRINNKIKVITTHNLKENIFSYFSLYKRLINRKIIKNEIYNSDYVIARTPCDDSYLAIKYALKYNKKILVEVVGCPFDTLWNHSAKGKILAIPAALRLRKWIKKSPNVLYVTKDFLQKRYPTKGKSIGCSDAILNVKSVDISSRIQKIKNMNSKKIVIGTLGAINVKYKGHEYVIQAIKLLENYGYEIEYQIVGGGSKERLEKISKKYNVEEKVKFVGTLSHNDVFEWLKMIDIYIQPSLTEGLPRSVIEAMSLGCPVVGTNVGGMSELIDNSFLVKKKNAKSIKNKILDLNQKKLIEQSKKNLEKSKEYEEKVLNSKRSAFYKSIFK